VSCPGAWSLTNEYNGIPPYVTCVPPSGREIVPSLLELTPLPAVAELTPAGRSTGGHVVAHESVHMIVPPLSDANAYSVDPLESTSTVPTPGIDFVPIMTDPACVVVELPPPELGAAFSAQADNAISAAAEAIQTRRDVLVDTFTFDQGRGSRARPDAPPRVFATGNTVGPQVRFIWLDRRDRPSVEPLRVPVRSTSACRARHRAKERRWSPNTLSSHTTCRRTDAEQNEGATDRCVVAHAPRSRHRRRSARR
jgi:hypothetical protein